MNTTQNSSQIKKVYKEVEKKNREIKKKYLYMICFSG